jgi:hypothetical protein
MELKKNNNKNIKRITFLKHMPNCSLWERKHSEGEMVEECCWVRALMQSLTVMSPSLNKINIRIKVNECLSSSVR